MNSRCNIKLAAQCITEVRQISRDLHPPQLDLLGLKRSLEILLENTATASDMKFDWKFDDTGKIFTAESAVNLYRIVQESLNNILKHSAPYTSGSRWNSTCTRCSLSSPTTAVRRGKWPPQNAAWACRISLNARARLAGNSRWIPRRNRARASR